MPADNFIFVANTEDLADPGSMFVEVDGQMIVLIHAAGHYYALDDLCTHDGGPLSGGRVDKDEGVMICPRHGARFELTTGAALTMPATKETRTHKVKVEGQEIYVSLNES